jgi:hypothetical protein
VALHEPQELARLKPRHCHNGRPFPQPEVQAALQAEDVKPRQCGEKDVGPADLVHGADLAEVGDKIAMGEHHALGQPGGTAGIR